MTVGSGITPDLLDPQLGTAGALAGFVGAKPYITAGGELHPALRTSVHGMIYGEEGHLLQVNPAGGRKHSGEQ